MIEKERTVEETHAPNQQNSRKSVGQEDTVLNDWKKYKCVSFVQIFTQKQCFRNRAIHSKRMLIFFLPNYIIDFGIINIYIHT